MHANVDYNKIRNVETINYQRMKSGNIHLETCLVFHLGSMVLKTAVKRLNVQYFQISK